MKKCCTITLHAVLVLLLSSYSFAQTCTGDLIWSDEFDYTGLPDPTKWGYDVGGSGWGNNEDQYYTDARSENARVENGNLIIEARRENYQGSDYTSARLVTSGKGDWLYGRIDVRAKIPVTAGTWPAIWLLPTDWEYGGWPGSGEIDIMENFTAWGVDPNEVHANIHTDAYNHIQGTNKGGGISGLSDITDNFHTYSLDWYPDRMDFSIDDIYYFSFANEGNTDAWPFDKRFHLILNVAIGGTGGGTVDDNAFPHQMIVDYVRVYENGASTNTPYSTAQSIPGTVEAEDYDGGTCPGDGHYDETSGNEGSTYRTDDADIDANANDYHIGWTEDGEWLEYTVDVAQEGIYDIEFLASSGSNGGTATLWLDDQVLSYDIDLPTTAGWDAYETTTISNVLLPQGVGVLKLNIVDGGFNLDEMVFTFQQAATQQPYNGSPISIPGRVEAEEYDLGIAQVSHYDNSAGNTGGDFRTDDVDIEVTSDQTGDYNVGWIESGEWLEYAIDVQQEGVYDFKFRTASPQGSSISASIDDVNVTGTVSVPNSGGWQDWDEAISNGVFLTEGEHVLRVNFEGGDVNYNYVDIEFVTSTSSLASAGVMEAWPNPFTDVIEMDRERSYELLNVFGESVIVSDGRQIDTGLLTKGVYVLRWQDAQGNTHNQQMIKQ